MHYLRIRLARPQVFTCGYAVRFGTFLAALFVLQSIMDRAVGVGRSWTKRTRIDPYFSTVPATAMANEMSLSVSRRNH
jgi:hypothetical protein